MESLKILNSKERKEVSRKIDEQFGCGFEFDYDMFMNNKNKVFILNRDASMSKIAELRINSLGLYFCEINERGELRLSIEGSQIIGKIAKKNILELDDEHASKWMCGEDFEIDSDVHGFVIIKNNSDFLGCGKIVNKRLYNYVPKERRSGPGASQN